MDADVLKSMFDASQQNHGPDSKFTPEEANRFRKAFEDPEFRKMFSEYMDELQDPKHREETEAYISQLEGEQKVPEGKELIRFVTLHLLETTFC
jgi:dynein assembly factor 2